jgi:hypothetical protein
MRDVMSWLRPLYLLVSILTLAIGVSVAIFINNLGWPYPIEFAVVPEPKVQWYENTFRRRDFSGEIKAVYVGTIKASTVGDWYRVACFAVDNNTNEPIFILMSPASQVDNATIEQDGRVVTAEPPTIGKAEANEVKPGSTVGLCIHAPQNMEPFRAIIPVQIGSDRVQGTVSIAVATPFFTSE